MLEFTVGRGRATLYRWDYEPRNKTGYITGSWKIMRNIVNYPMSLAKKSFKNTLFDPNFNYMISMDNIANSFYIWNLEGNYKEINIPNNILGYGTIENSVPSNT